MTLPGLSLGPRMVERPADAGYTLVGILDDEQPSKLDRGGILNVDGASWCIDWWIGADDRWYFPAREATTRQSRLGPGPVVETAVRIPSGDAIHRCYPVTVRGQTATVIEVENDSPVPVALALAIRPYDLTGSPGARGADEGRVAIDDRLVTFDGKVALCLPRRANERLASNRDVSAVVTEGQALTGAAEATGENRNAVVLYPLPHRTKLRFVVPGLGGSLMQPGDVPDVEAVQRGWESVLDGGGRVDLPDNGISGRLGAARARLLLSTGDLVPQLVDLMPGAGRWLEALSVSGKANDARVAMLALASSFPTRLGGQGGASAAGSIVAGVGRAVAVLDDAALAEDLLETLAQLTHLVERSGDKAASSEALTGLGWALRAAGQPDVAIELLGKGRDLTQAISEQHRLRADIPGDLTELTALGEEAGAAGSWGNDDLARASRYVLGARDLLVAEDCQTLDLLPGFPTAWRGGGLEAHNLRTVHGQVSFAIRWHGARPALLWDTALHHSSSGPIELTCRGLDASWSTTDPKGETLLEGAANELPRPPSVGESFA